MGSLPTPFYADDLATLYLADALELREDLPRPALLLTDPPYGVNEETMRAHRGRPETSIYAPRRKGRALAKARDFPKIVGDDRPFDPTPWLSWSRAVLFGANNYAAALPPSNGWIVWDKVDGLRSVRSEKGGEGFNNNGDAELAWTNIIGAVRIVRHRWMGLLKGSERRENRHHPTQKPVELFARIIRRYALPGEIILDPYAGSGSTLVAAVREGHPTVGVEIVPRYAEVIRARLRAEAEVRRGG